MKTTKKYLASAYYAQGTILVILKSEKKKNQAPTWPQGAPSNEPWTSVDIIQSKKCPVTEERPRELLMGVQMVEISGGHMGMARSKR